MKPILTILTIFTCLNLNAQKTKDYCEIEDFGVISPGYIAPKSFSLSVDYFTKIGLVVGAGWVYTVPKTYEVKQGENTYEMQTNSFDIYGYLGWRIARVDYVVSVFGIAGYTMGNVDKFQPFGSLRVLFPIGNNALSVEPVYVVGRGMTGKLAWHIKL
ncbi:MAG TPA: hypothetical protein PKV73_00960 [Agriterribacter sp.]|nr:hypothetical protein [Agriterribacter sp.]